MQSVDTYTFRARVVPVLVVVLPPLALFGASVVWGTRLGSVSGLVASVVATIAAQLGRDRGRAMQDGLWAEWGGGPALQRLRFRTGGRRERVERLHVRIEEVLGERLPDESAEMHDPDGADADYQEAVERLIGRTRDKTRFGLLFAENVNYGQRRNLLGLRRIGIAVAAATLALAIALMLTGDASFETDVSRYAPGALVAVLTLAFWIVVVTRSWVRLPAEAYADRLVESADRLADDQIDAT